MRKFLRTQVNTRVAMPEKHKPSRGEKTSGNARNENNEPPRAAVQ